MPSSHGHSSCKFKDGGPRTPCWETLSSCLRRDKKEVQGARRSSACEARHSLGGGSKLGLWSVTLYQLSQALQTNRSLTRVLYLKLRWFVFDPNLKNKRSPPLQ